MVSFIAIGRQTTCSVLFLFSSPPVSFVPFVTLDQHVCRLSFMARRLFVMFLCAIQLDVKKPYGATADEMNFNVSSVFLSPDDNPLTCVRRGQLRPSSFFVLCSPRCFSFLSFLSSSSSYYSSIIFL